MNEEKKLYLNLKLSELTDIWKVYCEFHTELYDLTCDEYVHLLASDMDKLEETITSKELLIKTINNVEDRRTLIINELNEQDENYNFIKLNEVVAFAKSNDLNSEVLYLEKYNALLLDIITRIQDQNKLNQLFLNKAITSLKDLKESFSGRKTFKTYGADGATRTKSVTP